LKSQSSFHFISSVVARRGRNWISSKVECISLRRGVSDVRWDLLPPVGHSQQTGLRVQWVCNGVIWTPSFYMLLTLFHDGSEDTVSCAEVAERGVLRRTAAAPAGVRSCCFVQRPRRHTTAREGAVSGCCVRQCICAPRWTAARPRGGRADGHRRGACLHRALRSSYLRSLNCGLVCTGQTLKQHFSSTSPCSPQCERPR
jgi:hypothetical protein